MCIKAGATYTGLHYRFSEIIADNGIAHIIEEPTQKNNTRPIPDKPSKQSVAS